MPSDTFQSIAIARMVRHFGWVYIGTIQNNEEYGREGIAQFVAESEDYGLCFAFQEVLPKKEDRNEIKRLGKSQYDSTYFRRYIVIKTIPLVVNDKSKLS